MEALFGVPLPVKVRLWKWLDYCGILRDCRGSTDSSNLTEHRWVVQGVVRFDIVDWINLYHSSYLERFEGSLKRRESGLGDLRRLPSLSRLGDNSRPLKGGRPPSEGGDRSSRDLRVGDGERSRFLCLCLCLCLWSLDFCLESSLCFGVLLVSCEAEEEALRAGVGRPSNAAIISASWALIASISSLISVE